VTSSGNLRVCSSEESILIFSLKDSYEFFWSFFFWQLPELSVQTGQGNQSCSFSQFLRSHLYFINHLMPMIYATKENPSSAAVTRSQIRYTVFFLLNLTVVWFCESVW
jgi:hypothetical protein